ncbi:unnamed protein product, partial [Staurois parvus]
MALGKKGLTCGAIKGLTVCWFTMCFTVAVHVLSTVSTWFCMALQCAGADGSELYCLQT